MAEIKAAEVQKLRMQTGAGMMDCKKALVENDGDFEKAIDYLRKKGQKVAVKRADKDANEGIVLAKTNAENTFAANLMINCETDFVAKNKEFSDFVENIIDTAIANDVKSLEELKGMDLDGRSVEERVMDMIGKIGEKIEVRHYEVIKAASVFAYNHQGNRLATTVGFNLADAPNLNDIGHEIAMQIAAMNPVAVDKENVDPAIVEREIEIGKEQARLEGKPEAILEKISMGKLNKFYKENTLLNQDFVRNTKMNVRDYLKSSDKDLIVTEFTRLMLGS